MPDTPPPGSEDHLARVQELTETHEALPDGPEKRLADELIAAIVELYGEGLARIVAALDEAGAAGQEIHGQLVEDGVVASLLLIHDLYPVSLEERVREALDSVRPYMESHGGDVELLGIEDGIARLRLAGHCKGCPASAATLELAIKDALDQAAPDLAGLEVEGVVATANGSAPTPTWMSVDSAGDVAPGELRTVEVRGAELIVANVDGTLLAYRSACAGCGAALGDATLSGAILTCARCGRGFDLPRAGRALGAGAAQLEPVPLLRPAGTEVKVALAGPRRPAPHTAACDLCGTSIPDDHRHLLHIHERRILCTCEPCWAMRSGEADLRPTGNRTEVLRDFTLPDELWAKFQIPIGLAFLFVSEVAGGVAALYPSPAGATESELHLAAWDELVAANPVLDGLEPEVEALIVNHLADPPVHAIVPIDRCYELVGRIKASWEGIAGGDAVQRAVDDFFARLPAPRSAP